MNDKILKNRRFKRWKSVVTALACIVVFCTTYALILPAITMESTTYCGMEEHTHGEECYETQLICTLSEDEAETEHEHIEECYMQEKQLVCQIEETLGHTHTEECKTVETRLVCNKQESEGHQHTDSCRTAEKILVCTEPESEGHRHSEACQVAETLVICDQGESEEHVHEENCYSEQVKIVCGQEEYEGHSHGDRCYEEQMADVCGQEEQEGHSHGENCYEEQSVYSCGQEECDAHIHGELCYETVDTLSCRFENEIYLEPHIHKESCYQEVFACEKGEHTHQTVCYSDPSADLENEKIWENTLPQELTGVWAEDLITVAESQLGYRESKKNYTVSETGELKGYTRYGAWYGVPYGDWCAMFASFCLNYAGINETFLPYEAGCQNWIEILSQDDYGLYYTAEAYVPIAGDLIFFDDNGDGKSNHVGIVVEVSEKEIRTIEGNTSDQVKYRTYEIDDFSIMGYAKLPENPEMTDLKEKAPEKGPLMFATGNRSDQYAPANVTLTGIWSEDVAAIAESQVGYTEINSISKFDQWAGNYGTGFWNINFVNYCLNYAQVDREVIPWDVSYDYTQWKSVLEGNGVLMPYDAKKLKAGDLVFVQGWSAGYNLNVGVCVEASGGAFYIVFGDMDGNNTVVREQFWESWTGRFVGYVPLSEILSTTVEGKLTATTKYNKGTFTSEPELVVNLTESSDTYKQLLTEHLVSEKRMICEDYYLDVYFEQNGNRVDPASSPKVLITFNPPLSTNANTSEDSGEVQWVYGAVNGNAIVDAKEQLQVTKNGAQDITDIAFLYQKDNVYALAATQGVKTMLEFNEEGISATATSQDLSADMRLVIRTLEENTENLVDQLKEVYETDKLFLTGRKFLEIEFQDEEGNVVELPDDAHIELCINFDPALSAAMEDGTIAHAAEWKLSFLSTDDTEVRVEEAAQEHNVILDVTKEQSLSSVSFLYDSKEIYALSAVVTDPDYYESVSSYEALVEALSREEAVAQIKLEGTIEVPEGSSAIRFTKGKTVLFDLNGYDIITNDTLFVVGEDVKFILLDSQETEETTEIAAQLNLRADEDGDSAAQLAKNKANVGQLASYDEQSETLTYYVTETEIVNAKEGATKETLVKHIISLKGNMKGGEAPVFVVENGSLTIQGGAVTNCTNGAIRQIGGTLDLNGGYICNHHRESGNGGAIEATENAVITVDGAVIAANSTDGDGGSIWIQGSGLSICSGIISGNEAGQSGGGVFATGSTSVNITGGYLTNNRAYSEEYRSGGGGIFTNENAGISISSGMITGNYAESGGGGIRTFASRFEMTGGYINSNYANLSEGGGLSINEYGSGKILGGYINNNVSNTHQHWGGGGIFTANDSTLFIRRVVVTDNDAGGYGGGVAGCSTGRAFVYEEDGGAIYDNTAVPRDSKNPHVSGGESTKAEDHLYPNSVFRQYGYEDYFCAFNSIISGTMLGGSSANWSGTVDGIPVVVAKDEIVQSTYLMGLDSNPEQSGIDQALQYAKVYVNGNDSYTHGGGILGNGYLVIGESDELEVYSRLKVEATKELSGGKLEAGQFEFIIENKNTGFLVAKGTNEEDGTIVFDHMIPFSEEGTYEFLIYEKQTSEEEGAYDGILMDTTQYKLTVKVGKIVEDVGDFLKYRYVIESMITEKQNGGEWETVQAIYNPENPDNKPVTLSLTRGTSFHNIIAETTKFSVMKKWVGDVAVNEISVQLLQNGSAYGDAIVLSNANDWTYTWAEELPLYNVNPATGEKTYYTYSVKELNSLEEYEVTYDSFNVTESKNVWIPYTEDELIEGKEYIIVSPDGAYVLYVSSLGGYHTLTEIDKATAAMQNDSIVVNGQQYDNYFYDNIISTASIYRAENHNGNLILKSIVVQDNMPLTSNWENGDKVLKSAWWPLKNMYVGNVRTCFGTNDANSKDMIVFENNKFDAVDYNSWNSNAAKLYTRATTSAESQTIFTITNTKVEEEKVTYKVNLTKVSAENNEVLLAGAKFALYHADENGEADLSRQIIFSKEGQGVYRYLTAKESTEILPTDISDAVTVRGGKLIFTELPKGKYMLVELEAPNGYLVIEPMLISVGEDSGQEKTYPIMIEDEVYQEAYELPDTGGSGTKVYTAGGILLLTVSVLLYIERKNRKKGGINST